MVLKIFKTGTRQRLDTNRHLLVQVDTDLRQVAGAKMRTLGFDPK